ncbi:MAG: site-2 protease family protein [Clostridia bacterium]|nr:site-2 protease family protein [Clostridia bacterium]
MFFLRFFNADANVSEILISLLAMILAAVTAIVLHEVSHGYVAMKCGDMTAKSRGRLTLNPVAHFDLIGLLLLLFVGFGWAKPVPVDPRNFKSYKKGMLLVSVSGVVTNILIGGLGLLVLSIVAPYIGAYNLNSPAIVIILKMLAYFYLVYLVGINFMLAFFNMLPIYPLDGFKLLSIFLKPGNKYVDFMYRYGFYCIIALILFGNIFRRLGLWYFDIFGIISSLISKLIMLVA